MLLLILELVRSRRLREEYSWLWLLTGSFVLAMLLRDEILDFLQSLTGATNHASTVYFFGNIFLMLICIQFSVRLSRMTAQIKTLGQKIALLEAERDEWRASRSLGAMAARESSHEPTQLTPESLAQAPSPEDSKSAE